MSPAGIDSHQLDWQLWASHRKPSISSRARNTLYAIDVGATTTQLYTVEYLHRRDDADELEFSIGRRRP